MPVIGLVFAGDPALVATGRDHRGTKPRIGMRIEDAHLPRPGRASAQLRGEAVDGADAAVRVQRRDPRQRRVIGAVQPVQPALAFGRVRQPVRRDHRAVIEPHQQGGVVLSAVRIDHQAREIRQDRGRVQPLGQPFRQTRRAHVIGDVASHVGGRDAQGAAADPVGHAVRGVIAGDQPPRGAVLTQDAEGRRCRVIGHDAGCLRRTADRRQLPTIGNCGIDSAKPETRAG